MQGGTVPLRTDPGPATVRIAVLPVEDLSGAGAPVGDLRKALLGSVRDQGVAVLEDDQVEAFLAKNRIRYIGGVEAAAARAWKEQAGADAVLITSCELYIRSGVPKIFLTSRLVSTDPTPAVLWMDSAGLSGDDAAGLLDIGLISDPSVVAGKAVDQLARSVARFIFEGRQAVSPGGKGPAPEVVFRSPGAGLDLRENTLSFLLAGSRIDEKSGMARIPVVLNARTGKPVQVDVGVTGGTAAGGGADYVLRERTLVFAPGETIKTIDLEVIDDKQYQGDKTVEMTLRSPRNAVLSGITVHAVTILDSAPPPSVRLTPASQRISEGAGGVTIRLELSAVSGKDVTVPFTVKGTATEGSDYRLSTTSPVVIEAGRRSAEITFDLVDDAVSEPDETIEVAMGIPVNAVQGDTATATVVIADNDPPPAAAALQDPQNAAPGGTAVSDQAPRVNLIFSARPTSEHPGVLTFRLELSAVSEKDVTVPFTVKGTAREGSDYRLRTPSPVVIKAGSKNAGITFHLIDDDINEPEETIEVVMGIPVNAVRGDKTAATVILVDNDPFPAVSFGAKGSRSDESVSPVRIKVVLSRRSEQQVKVDYVVTGGTATGGGVDYALRDGTLVFAPGETVKTIDLEVADDKRHEVNESVELMLRNPVNAVLGEVTVHTAMIIDNDPQPSVNLTPSVRILPRQAGSLTFLLELSAASGEDVTVPFMVGGTATEGADYRLVTPGPAVIKAGERGAGITVTLTDPPEHVADKTLEIKLQAPTNAVLGPQHVLRLTIEDRRGKPTVAVLPFFNESSRRNAGDVLMLEFVRALRNQDRFEAIEPGVLRQHLLNMRTVMNQGVSLADAGPIFSELNADLILSGRVLDFEELEQGGAAPRVDFSLDVIERRSGRTVWSAKSQHRGDEDVLLFDWKRVSSANVLAERMVSGVVEKMASE